MLNEGSLPVSLCSSSAGGSGDGGGDGDSGGGVRGFAGCGGCGGCTNSAAGSLAAGDFTDFLNDNKDDGEDVLSGDDIDVDFCSDFDANFGEIALGVELV
jgi:hypothetical protein